MTRETTVFNDHLATHDKVIRIEEWKVAADDYYSNHAEAIIIFKNSVGHYALEALK